MSALIIVKDIESGDLYEMKPGMRAVSFSRFEHSRDATAITPDESEVWEHEESTPYGVGDLMYVHGGDSDDEGKPLYWLGEVVQVRP